MLHVSERRESAEQAAIAGHYAKRQPILACVIRIIETRRGENLAMDAAAKKADLLEAFNYRFATKEFDHTKKISDEDFQFILEAGRLSPSSGGNEPWKFVVVQSPEFRKELAPHTYGALRQLPTSSHFVIILARKGLTYDNSYLVEQQTKIKGMPWTFLTA